MKQDIVIILYAYSNNSVDFFILNNINMGIFSLWTICSRNFRFVDLYFQPSFFSHKLKIYGDNTPTLENSSVSAVLLIRNVPEI